ncbi:MucBP domain-containing protein [Lactiplantibacillus garii]|nr:MucBP domain-containing protein [Lactiplantibacillus garii]
MNSEKVHYKMYKRGKIWIAAGITISTLGFYNQLEVHAATPATESSVTTQTDVPSLESATATSATPTTEINSTNNETGSDSSSDAISPVKNDSQAATNVADADHAHDTSSASTDDTHQAEASTAPSSEAQKPADTTNTTSEASQTSQPASDAAGVKAPADQTVTAEQPTSAADNQASANDQSAFSQAAVDGSQTPVSASPAASADAEVESAASLAATDQMATMPDTTIVLPETAPVSFPQTPAQPVINERAREIVAEDEDINVWMPDKNMQYIVLYNLQKAGYKITEASQITKQMMADMEDFFVNTSYQIEDLDYLKASLAIESLEGLQYAKNIGRFSMTISLDAFLDAGYPMKELRSKLWDISALKGMNQLTEFTLQFTSVTDVSLIKDMNKLWLFSISGNYITDVSPVPDVIQHAQTPSPIGNQIVYMPGVYLHLDPVTGKYVTTSYIVGLDGKRVGVKPSEKATAEGHNIDDYTIEWTNLGAKGMMVMEWDTPGLLGSVTGYPFDGKIVVPYILDDSYGNAVVNFVDEAGNQISQQLNLHDKLGNTQDLTQNAQVAAALAALKQKGLSVKEVKGDVNWTASDQLNSVTFVMETTKQKVTVHAKDEDGQDLENFPDTGAKGTEGSDWTITIPTMPGYDFVSAQQGDQTLTVENGQLTGQFGTEDTEITLNYKKKVGKVTTHYVDTDGNELEVSETVTGKVGTDYAVEPKPIKGWHFASTQGQETGQFTDGELEVTFVYEKDEDLATPGEPDPDPNGPSEPGKPDPSEPGKPEPSEPGQPGQPGPGKPGPSEPGEPDPSEPSEPSQPGQPGPSEPGKPDPSEPSQPGPSEPGKPNPTDPKPGPSQPGPSTPQPGQPNPTPAPGSNGEKPTSKPQPQPAPTKPQTGAQPAPGATTTQRPGTQPTTKPTSRPSHRPDVQVPTLPVQDQPMTKPAQDVTVVEAPAAPASKPATTPADVTPELPQTDEHTGSWLQRLGLVLAGLTAGLVWMRKKQ